MKLGEIECHLYRAATSSLSDLEVKLNKSIERNVILGK